MNRICKTHGDLMRACRNQHARYLYCDGQGSRPVGHPTGAYGMCHACGKIIRLRADGTVRSHNGRGK